MTELAIFTSKPCNFEMHFGYSLEYGLVYQLRWKFNHIRCLQKNVEYVIQNMLGISVDKYFTSSWSYFVVFSINNKQI